jgi:uncharacterized protein (TIGR03083 family)
VDLRDDATYKSWLAAATDRFAGALADADLDAAVPTCPGWDVATLAEHVVAIHSWVEKILTTAQRQSDGDAHQPPDRQPRRYADWYRQRSTAMRRLMDTVEAAAQCWNFSGVNTTYGFWPRRQTHEVSVHTFDIAVAGGAELAIEPDVAVDGIDELLRVFGVRMPQRGFPARLAAPVAIVTDDAGAAWTLDPPPTEGGAVVVSDGSRDDAAGSVRGTASDVLLTLWKRLPTDRITITGDAAVAAAYLGSRLVP